MLFGAHVALGAETPRSARHLESLGFDYVTCGERLEAGVPTTTALVTLAAAAAATTRVGLLTGITVAPYYPATLLAKMATTVDVISGGRLVLGVGVGGDDPRECDAAGISTRSRGARTDEALEILKAVWRDDVVDFHGEFAELRQFRLLPRPIQPSGPPVWISGRSTASLARAARVGDGWLPYLVTESQYAETRRDLVGRLEAAGRDPSEMTFGLACLLNVHEDGQTSKAMALEHVATAWRQDFSKGGRDRFLITGTPHDIIRRLSSFGEAGAEFVTATLVGPGQDEMANVLAREVLPVLRQRFPSTIQQSEHSGQAIDQHL